MSCWTIQLDRRIDAEEEQGRQTTMITTITEVIQVSFRLVQVILRASARTSRKNSTGRMRGFGGDASTGSARRRRAPAACPWAPRPVFRPARPLNGALGA